MCGVYIKVELKPFHFNVLARAITYVLFPRFYNYSINLLLIIYTSADSINRKKINEKSHKRIMERHVIELIRTTVFSEYYFVDRNY